MIDRKHNLPVTRQCEILRLARSNAYYTPEPTSPADLALMRRIDELHLEHPFAGGGAKHVPVSGSTWCPAKLRKYDFRRIDQVQY